MDPDRTDPASRFSGAPALLLDGGLATELEARGADLRDRLWSARMLVEDPGLIRSVHEAFFAAGAEVATTASYQASLAGFAARGLPPAQALGLIRLSVQLAAEARGRQPADGRRRWVAGSVGPYGAALADGSEYRGGYAVSERALREFHRPRLEALIEAGADLVAIETQPSPREVLVILDLLAAWPGVPAWVSYTCRDAAHVAEGQPVAQAAAAAAASRQVVAVGVNCVAPALVEELLARFRDATDRPLVAYPNAGHDWDPAARAWRGRADALRPERDLPRWVALGARLVGGCCRVGPATIRQMRAALDAGAPSVAS